MILYIAIGIELITLIIILIDSGISLLTKICAVLLTVLIFIPDPIPYIDEIILMLMVFKDPNGSAKFLSISNAAVWILTSLMP